MCNKLFVSRPVRPSRSAGGAGRSAWGRNLSERRAQRHSKFPAFHSNPSKNFQDSGRVESPQTGIGVKCVDRENTNSFAWTSPTRRKMAVLATLSATLQRICALVFWLLMLALALDAQNRSHEVQTLLRFKNTVGGDSAGLTQRHWSTWNETDSNPCLWWGVTCTVNSTVEQLILSDWGLTRLPSLGVLSDLPDLSRLDLSNNNFTTGAQANLGVSIPDDIGSLVQLTYLDLSYGPFSGPIPLSISSCRYLWFLNVEGNRLTGEIPDLSALVNLQTLDGAGNQLEGPFPKWLEHLNNLVQVDLSNNMLTGTIPSVSNLTNLSDLRLNNCNFTGFEEPLFPNANRLQWLIVAANQLQGPIPPSITKLLNLNFLDLSQNQLNGSIPSGFSSVVSNGVSIDLSQNQLTGSIPESLLQPTIDVVYNFASLNLSNNFLTGDVPFDGTKQYYYWTIDFSYNNLSGTIPSICRNGTSYFYQFWLHNNNLQGDIVDFLVDCYDRINDLRLADNSFSGDLSRLANINTSLDAENRAQYLSFGYRDLSNNNLQIGVTPANSDSLSGVLDFFIMNTSLIEFRMQGNNFSGTPLPASFPTSANALQVLDLSSNQLVGGISAAAFNSTWFPALEFLNLSRNHLTGPIPQAIFELPNLGVLDVTNNSLFGPLPATVPSWLDPRFFAGNLGLCGFPLHVYCPSGKVVQHWWVFFSIIVGSIVVALGSCLVATWQWKVYSKRHKQDADLIKTLLERDCATLMSLRELKKATNNFAKSSQVGEGACGAVYEGTLTNGTRVAIKRSKSMASERDKEQFLNEVRILSQVNHRNLVQLLGCCMENKVALLVFEFVSNGTLQQHLRGKVHDGAATSLSWKQRLKIAIQTADALNYLHSATTFPIYHRDVKSANILLTDDLNAKVADFGISKLAPLEATHVSTMAVQGTMGYIDPEYHNTGQLTSKSDVYSFGVVLLELISGKPPIDPSRNEDEKNIVDFASPFVESGDLERFIDPTLTETYSSLLGKQSILDVGRLALQCLDRRSRSRPNMNEVWIDLRGLWLEIDGSHWTSMDGLQIDGKHFTSIHEEHEKISEGNIGVSKSCTVSMSSLHTGRSVTIQMSQFLTQ